MKPTLLFCMMCNKSKFLVEVEDWIGTFSLSHNGTCKSCLKHVLWFLWCCAIQLLLAGPMPWVTSEASEESSDVGLSNEDADLVPSLPLPSPNIIRERKDWDWYKERQCGFSGVLSHTQLHLIPGSKEDIVVSWACCHIHSYTWFLARIVPLYWTL